MVKHAQLSPRDLPIALVFPDYPVGCKGSQVEFTFRIPCLLLAPPSTESWAVLCAQEAKGFLVLFHFYCCFEPWFLCLKRYFRV